MEKDKNTKEELHDILGKYYVSQSTATSETGRKIIWGIIGTIWFIIYTKQGTIVFPNCLVAASVISGFLYLACDYAQYSIASRFYFKKAKETVETDENDEHKLKEIKIQSEKFSSQANLYFNIKIFLLIVTFIFFVSSILNIIIDSN